MCMLYVRKLTLNAHIPREIQSLREIPFQMKSLDAMSYPNFPDKLARVSQFAHEKTDDEINKVSHGENGSK